MWQHYENSLARFQELERQLGDPAIIGDRARFTQVAGEYAKASQVNGERLYLETMETILPKIKKLIVDNKGNLDLTIIRRGEK